MFAHGEITVEDVVTAINDHLANSRREWTPVSPSTRLDELDLDSFEIANVVLTLEEAKGCRLTFDSLADAELVSDLVTSAEIV